VFYDNRRDLFVEVSHGPYLVEHNVFASPASLELFSQGGAFVNNLVCGTVSLQPVVDRPTPFHVPHSTQVAGYAAIYGGDDRHVGNIYLGGNGAAAYGETAKTGQAAGYGTAGYNGHPSSRQEYLASVDDVTQGDHQRFVDAKQAVYISDNVYAGGASPYEGEKNAMTLSGCDIRATVVDEGDQVHLETQLPAAFDNARVSVITGADLEPVRFVDAEYEEPDGSPASATVDLIGTAKLQDRLYPPGPLASLTPGRTRLRLW
jgi:hypothetical protein